ncbi:hypothetical protein ACQKII_23025 [Lysinibacillus sp. NPDC048646]|uniref:hypothetical protein n=1 Tax=Lysinibacillus sp. NPDC048646 TaxID=3390574 RepID=UPI003D04E1A5
MYIEKITLCEYVNENFEAVNAKKVFCSADSSVQVLVQLNEIQQDTIIKFNWYKSHNDKEQIIGIYEIPIIGKKNISPRYAIAGFDIPLLMEEEPNGFSEKWGVLIELNGDVESMNFEFKKYKNYDKELKSNIQITPSSTLDWKA